MPFTAAHKPNSQRCLPRSAPAGAVRPQSKPAGTQPWYGDVPSARLSHETRELLKEREALTTDIRCFRNQVTFHTANTADNGPEEVAFYSSLLRKAEADLAAWDIANLADEARAYLTERGTSFTVNTSHLQAAE
jgi:hypothetical protein